MNIPEIPSNTSLATPLIVSPMVQQIAEAVNGFQVRTTGHAPLTVTVVLSEDTLVITLNGALSTAEKALARSAEGAAQVQDFHRQLFATSSLELREEIKRITGRNVREATAEVEPMTGSIVHAFTTGTMVQVFLLNGVALPEVKDSLTSSKRNPNS